MKLIGLGCSFTEGCPQPYQRDRVWVKYLSDRMDCDYVNIGRSGAGHDHTSYLLMSLMSDKKYHHRMIKWKDIDNKNRKIIVEEDDIVVVQLTSDIRHTSIPDESFNLRGEILDVNIDLTDIVNSEESELNNKILSNFKGTRAELNDIFYMNYVLDFLENSGWNYFVFHGMDTWLDITTEDNVLKVGQKLLLEKIEKLQNQNKFAQKTMSNFTDIYGTHHVNGIDDNHPSIQTQEQYANYLFENYKIFNKGL